MDTIPGQVFDNYVKILKEAKPTQETPWYGEFTFDEKPQAEYDGPITYETNVVCASEDLDVLKEKRNPMKHEDLIEKAHPEKVYVANGLGDGGLVENQHEQHAKIMEVINKLPTGDHIHLHAADILAGLCKIADEMEEKQIKEASLVHETIVSLVGDLKKKEINKVAMGPFAGLALLGAGSAGLYALVSPIFGLQEGILEDTRDLKKEIESWAKDDDVAPFQSVVDKVLRLSKALEDNASAMPVISANIIKSNNPQDVHSLNNRISAYTKDLKELEFNISFLRDQLPGKLHMNFLTTLGRIHDCKTSLKKMDNVSAQVARERQKAAPTTNSPLAEVAEHARQHQHQHSKPIDSKQESPTPTSAPNTNQILEVQEWLEQNKNIQLGNKMYTIVSMPIKLDGTLNLGTKQALINIMKAVRARLGPAKSLRLDLLFDASVLQIEQLIELAQNADNMYYEQIR